MQPVTSTKGQGLVSAETERKLRRLAGEFLEQAENLLSQQIEGWLTAGTRVLDDKNAAQNLVWDNDLRSGLSTVPDPEQLAEHRRLIEFVQLMDPDYLQLYCWRTGLFTQSVILTTLASTLADDIGLPTSSSFYERYHSLLSHATQCPELHDLRYGALEYFPELGGTAAMAGPLPLARSVHVLSTDPNSLSAAQALIEATATFAITRTMRQTVIPLIGAFADSRERLASASNVDGMREYADTCRELRGVMVEVVDSVDRLTRASALTHALRSTGQATELGLGPGPLLKVPEQVSFELQGRLLAMDGVNEGEMQIRLPEIVQQVVRDVREAVSADGPGFAR